MPVIAPTLNVAFTPPSTVTDIGSYVRSWKSTRGRTSVLSTYQPGTAEIVLQNRSGIFDPSNAAGTFYGKLVPGRRVQLLKGGTAIFTGRVYDWDLGYDVHGNAIAVMKCVDDFAILANRQIRSATTMTRQAAGARIYAVLAMSEVGYSAPLGTIGTGAWEYLQADTVAAGTNALQYLQLVERTDWGRLFMDRTGTLTFRDRRSLFGSTPAATFTDAVGGTFKYMDVQRLTGSEILRNQATVTRLGGTPQTVSDATSITAYDGTWPLDSGFRDLLLDSDSDAYIFADYLVQTFKDPTDTFSSVTVEVDSLSSGNRATVLGIDIGSVVTVVNTAPGVASALTQTRVVEGVTHQNVVGELHTVKLDLAEINEVSTPFTLDSSALDGPALLAF